MPRTPIFSYKNWPRQLLQAKILRNITRNTLITSPKKPRKINQSQKRKRRRGKSPRERGKRRLNLRNPKSWLKGKNRPKMQGKPSRRQLNQLKNRNQSLKRQFCLKKEGIIVQSRQEEAKDEDLGNVDSGPMDLKITLGGNSASVTGADGRKVTLSPDDINAIKQYIQDINKATSPIGRLIDYLPDDIDSMNKELKEWSAKSQEFNDKFASEKKKTEEELNDLMNELTDLEDSIADEKLKRRNLKSRVLKNEHIVDSLVGNVMTMKN